MSRVGKQPITVPNGVQVTISGADVSVKGPKGTLSRTFHSEMDIKQEGQELSVTPKKTDGSLSAYHGLSRALLNNMVVGVSDGFTKRLKLIGVGYRGAAKGKGLNLTLGYSHPVEYDPPEGIETKMEGQTNIVVTGADKELVGRVAAIIRGFRPPEPYHGKGVRYEDERIITKVGKAAGKK